MKSISYVAFHALCCIGAMALIGRCIYLYILDEDITQVVYHKYHDPEFYFYPSFSFCFKAPFLGYESFKPYFQEKTDDELKVVAKNYRKNFLTGKLLSNLTHTLDHASDLEKYFEVDYDNVTKRMEESISQIQIRLKNGVSLNYKLLNGSFNLNHVPEKGTNRKILKKYFKYEMPTFHISSRRKNTKCYAFSPPFIPHESIGSFRIYIIPTIFRDERLNLQKEQFNLKFHYPNQHMRALSNNFGWKSKYANKMNEPKFYTRKYILGSLEVVRRRNKHTQLCIEGKYDESIHDEAIKTIGCKTPVTMSKTEAPFCKSRKSFDDFNDIVDKKDNLFPCNEIESLLQWHEEKKEIMGKKSLEKKFRKTGLVEIDVRFLGELYKEIRHVKAYCIESLIGNAGGYIG